jgi:hypothetical protein
MPESENTVGKSWLTEGVILFLIPVLAYFFAFQYECGYCHTFGLPSYFIKPDLTEILIFATVTMGYAILCFWVLNAWLDLGTKQDPQLAMVFLGAMLAAAMGNSEALHQESFLVPSSNTNAIVIRCYGDKFICVTIDPSTKRPTKTFFLLPMTSEQNVQFSLQRIGPLNLELFYQAR